ncbi:MBL fold metallo-hydrolase [Staphylococcus muscae]|uniref:Metallo-beta-lactamase superfamily protein n=1 Tax=Staphylococcus muscae TaxID=1294 RepID=A0A240C5J4_9STAP|nr:MBL fold metallo-hydrolase [Staphylococcus muscae]AVQ33409.1 MBL fold metallo-hydrolase [Staphylococcus muscae]PNZ04309.1 MBL fold metallo-hydrolase [Staphylococcus muscae]GGA89928.1 UPF0173 protein YddR [Staphylococcus muscae]SNW03195.1 metallo-beta-lactamase superfamily protein [Staphylococcus muscae]
MKIQLIRNATLIVDYADKRFLIDPFLGEKHRYPTFEGAHSDELNPTVELPMSIEEVIEDIDAVVVTHTHYDHWDEVAIEVLPKNLPILALSESIATEIREQSFTDVRITTGGAFEGIDITRTTGRHGHGEIAVKAGEVWGIVLRHRDESSLYIAGDTVYYEEVENILTTEKPDIMVLNAGGNQYLEGGPFVMDMDDLFSCHQTLPTAKIVSVHMEAINTAKLSRTELKQDIAEKQLTD